MPTDFKYVPTSGDLSGRDFEHQTERAFNELGADIDSANETAQSALDTANAANQMANAANETADTALTQTIEAKETANTALGAAQQAQREADAAQQDANKALNQSANAQTLAGEALDTAKAAHEMADTAQESAKTSERDAQEALVIAQGAYDVSRHAVGVFVVDDELVDANEEFDVAEKRYLTHSSTGTPNLNFPADLTMPAWFEVYITDDSQHVTQTCWNESSELIYSRTGEVNHSDPDNPVATWQPWNSVAVPEIIKSVSVKVDPDGQPAGTYLVIVSNTNAGDVTSYVNLSQIIGAGYTAGNGAIDISADNKISLRLDPGETGLLVGADGLRLQSPETPPSTNITYGTTDLTAGSSPLATGAIYLVYE